MKTLLWTKGQDYTRLVAVMLGLVLAAGSVFMLFYEATRNEIDPGSDFIQFYRAGEIWRDDLNIYDREVFRRYFPDLTITHLYPPHANVLFETLTFVPLETSNHIFAWFNFVLLVGCLVMMLYMLWQFKSRSIFDVIFVLLLVNTGFGRGNFNFSNGQFGIIVYFLILLTFILAYRKRDTLAGMSLSLITIKPTFFPLYFLYYLLKQRYRLVIVCLIAFALMLTLSIVLSGRELVPTIMNWLHESASASEPGTINDTSPTFPYSALLVNLQPLVFRLLNTDAPVAAGVSWLLLFAAGVYSAYQMLRVPQTGRQQFLDLALISALSLLAVYHRAHDIALLFPGLLCIYLHIHDLENVRQKTIWAGVLAVILVVISIPGDLSTRILTINTDLQNAYLFRVIAPYQAWVSLLLLVSLLVLKTRAVRVAAPESELRYSPSQQLTDN